MAHGNYGLSLLSRGVGEQRHSGKSHKVEVLLEPEDYFNIQRKGYYLPPIHHQAWANEELSPRTVHAHKTYTTRKGALLLYAEDLALSHPAKHQQKARRKSLEAEDSKYFNTMKDLRSAVLSYGAKDQQGGNVFMGFNNSKMNNFNSPRSVRPGFSAKRYLANWSKSWDDSILNYLRSEGHLWDKNLFESNSVMPGLYRRINDDMSHVPPPYRVTRNMLLSPGDIVTYEFYRIRPDDMEYGTGDSLRHGQQPHPSPETAMSTTSGMIAAIARDGEQKPHPVLYSQLDRSEQQLVLQKLILQSAAHHNQGKLENIQADLPDSQVMILDMDQAITNLVTSNSENLLAGGKVFSIPEVPTEEPYSDSTPSESSWPDVVEKEVYEEVAPQIPKSASFSSVELLPPIAVPKQQTLDLMGSAQSTRLSHGQIDFRLPEISKGSPLPGIGVQPTTESVQELKTGRNEDVSDAQYSEVNPSEEKHEEDKIENETVTFTPQQTDSRQREMSSERKESDSRISSSSQLSQSFEDLNLADEQLTSMKGGVVPKNRTEGMRSYKGSRGRGSAGSHRSEILQGDEDLISVVGSVISAPSERAVSDTGGADKASKEETMKDTPEEGEEEDGSEKEEEKASMVSSSRGPIEIPTGSELSGDQEEQAEYGAEVSGPRKIADSQESVNKEDSKLAESIENKSSDYKTEDDLALKDTGDSSKDHVAAALEDGEVGESAEIHQKPASRASGMEVMDSKDLSIISPGLDGASGIGGTTELYGVSGLEGELEVDGATMVQPGDADEKAPSASPHQEMGSNQKLPTASIGSDLAEDAAVSENSFPKSKTRTSVPSEAGSVRSVQDGIFSMSEFFTNFSYKGRRDSDRSSWWSGRGSVPSSLASDADDTEIASLAGDSAATGDGWPQVDGEKDQTTSDQSAALPSSREDDVLKSDEADSEARLVNDDSLMVQSNLQQSEDVHPELDTKSVSDIGEEGNAVLSQKSDEMARHTSSRASSLMDQLEDEAAAVAKAVLQRPMSGRDLAEDAQLAAALWRERLGQLFQVARPPPDDTRSMIERRRKNSLDGSSVASFDLGHWDGSDLSTGRKHRSRRERRVSSAQAAVDLTNELPAGHLRAASLADSEVKVIITLSEDEADGDDKSEAFASGAISVRDEMSRASARVETKPKSALSVRLGSSQSGRHSSASILPESSENIEVAPTPSLQEPPPLSQSPTPSRGSAKSVRSKSSQSSRKTPSVLQRSEGFGEIRSDSRKSSSHSRSKSATSIPDRAPSPSENENENLTAKSDSLDQPVSKSETGEDGELEMNPSNPPKTAFSEGSVQESLTKGESTASAEEIPKETAISAEKDEAPPSAPQQNLSGGDSLQLDVTNFGVGERGDVTTKSSQRRESESKEDEELKKIVEDAGLLSRTSETASTKKSKGSKSSKSQKSDKSSTKSGKSQKSGKDSKNADKTKEFIVSMPHDDKEDYLAYKPAPEPEPKVPPETGKAKLSAPKPPPKKQKKEKAKKAKKAKKADAPKKEEPAAAKKDEEKDEKTPAETEKEKVEEAVEDTEESSKDAEPQKDDGDAAENSEEEDKQEEEEDATREEVESPEFIIIHEEFSDSEPEEEEPQPVVEQSSAMESHEEAYMSEVETEYTENSAHRPGSLSRSQARAAKRAAESERKKREIDRKRREKEEARRKAQEEEERKERIKREFEEERRKKEEQIRLKKEAEEEAKRKAEQAQRDRARQAELAAERERKQQEEYKRRLEEMAKKKKEEEKLRQEMEAQRLKEEAERKKEEEEMLAKMEEEERLEYERRKREEELLAQIKAEEEKVRREIEAKLAQEEAERLALEMAKRQKELEMRMQFNRELNAEANIFAHSQEVTRAFTWSYFELLEYLGIPIPAHLREKYLKGQLVSQNHQEMHGETKESEDG